MSSLNNYAQLGFSRANDGEVSREDLEGLFVNNYEFDRIAAHLNRFNPIKTMNMAHMEIRHSAILAWLLDPTETHNLGDRFLKAFVCAALQNHLKLTGPNALEVSQSDLRDAQIRREWQRIDILILSPTNKWAFIIENKFHSKQSKGQLERYLAVVRSHYQGGLKQNVRQGEELKVQGIFLTLREEEAEDQTYAPVFYEDFIPLLDQIIDQQKASLSAEVRTFIGHYLDILKDKTGMNEQTNELERLARQLYQRHRKALDFVMKHGANTEFLGAVRNLFGDEIKLGDVKIIGKQEFVVGTYSSNAVSFLPKSWYEALGKDRYRWLGCESWWAGYPINVWFHFISDGEGAGGKLRLNGELGPLANYETRKSFILKIKELAEAKRLTRIRFVNDAIAEGKRFSRFLKGNSERVDDATDAESIANRMVKLLEDFKPELAAISEVLPELQRYGTDRGA